jgi:endonuclease/exonuclease/phosphatase family metal-dependent hydrolase
MRPSLRPAIVLVVIATLVACFTALRAPADPLIARERAYTGPTFKVATWNVRGGSGITGWVGSAGFESGTGNCTDPKKPLNAWGVGAVQPFLTKYVADDPEVVAFGTQEGWGCTRPAQVAPLLTGWKKWTHSRAGVSLFTRYGIAGQWEEFQIEKKGVGGMTEDRWIIGGNVCLVADCTRTAHVWSTHLAPAADQDWPRHVQKVLDYLATKPQPQVWMGDLNLWKWDRWSPRVTCGEATWPMAAAYDRIMRAGYIDAWAATQSGPGWSGMTSRKASRGRTYCGKNNDGTPFKRIDYVLAKGITPIDTELFGFNGPGKWHPSDHLGLKATLRMPDQNKVAH